MKKHFLGRSKIFLMVGITALFILGSAAIIGLKGTTPLFAQPSVPLSRLAHHFCVNVGGSVQGWLNSNAACYGQVNSSNPDNNSSATKVPSVIQWQVPLKNPNGGSNSSSTPSPSFHPSPTSVPSGNSTQGGQTQTGSADTATQAAQAAFNQINTARAQAGLPALQWNTQLVNSAHKHNLAMKTANQLSHQLASEPALSTRISQEGVNWSFIAENIGYSSGNLHPTNTATSLNQDMLNEQPPNDGHRRNILSNANCIGIDVFIDTQNQKTWLTEDFARTA